MSYSLNKSVAFGSSKIGLVNVGYQLINSDGTNNGLRINTGIVEIGGGFYLANIVFPDDFNGFVKWDSGDGVIAVEEIENPLLIRTLTESYAADGAAPSLQQILFMIYSVISQFQISGSSIICKKLDGVTNSMTFSLNDATSPTSRIRSS